MPVTPEANDDAPYDRKAFAKQIEDELRAENGEVEQVEDDHAETDEVEDGEDLVADGEDEATESEEEDVEETREAAPKVGKAFGKEREKRRAAQAAAEEARRELEDLKKQVAELRQSKEEPPKQEAAPDPEPDKDEDFVGWLQWRDRQVSSRVEDLDKRQKSMDQQVAMSRLAGEIKQHEASYAGQHDDYFDAVEHMTTQQIAYMADRNGFDADKLDKNSPQYQQIKQAVLIHNLQLCAQALDQGQNPAEILYRSAKRFGYQGKSASAKKSPVSRVGTLKSAQAASNSLSEARGVGPVGTASASALMNKQPGTAEFGKILAKLRQNAQGSNASY